MDRRRFLKSAAGLAAITGFPETFRPRSPSDLSNPFHLYWGDLHCHCGISYGRGTLENAFKAAQENRLDFCSVVGHSSWHDTPRDDEHMNRIKGYIVYHDEGYERLAKLWPRVKQLTREVTNPGRFIPFLAFEWHSIKYGDHNVIYLEPEGEIVKADSIGELRNKMKGKDALVIPHHIAYGPGSRGINWDTFEESLQSPFVEVYSFHGCSVSDTSPYPMLREMGARSSERTMESGLQKGYKFGIYASTDNHYGYPGSYGEGKVGVYAQNLTRQSLWEAFQARRLYAVTGDRIFIDFKVDDLFMGEAGVRSGKRNIQISIVGEDFLDYVEINKNGRIIHRFNPPFSFKAPKTSAVRAKIRLQWGWGVKTMLREWEGRVKLTDGRLIAATPCFCAQHSEGDTYDTERGIQQDYNSFISRINEQDETSLTFHSYSFGNPTPLTPINNSIVLDVEMPLKAKISALINGKMFEHTLDQLLKGQCSHLIGGYLDAAVSFFRAVPQASFTFNGSFVDKEKENPTDYYYLTVRQKNNQWGWSSPVWIS